MLCHSTGQNFKEKKWYWPLLVNAINLGMVFCWRVYQLSNKNITQKDYICTIVHIQTKRSTTTFRADARPGPSYTLPAEVRTDNSDHLPMFVDALFVRKTVEYVARNVTNHCISILASKYSMKNRNSDQCMYISFREPLMSDVSIYFTIFSEF